MLLMLIINSLSKIVGWKKNGFDYSSCFHEGEPGQPGPQGPAGLKGSKGTAGEDRVSL